MPTTCPTCGATFPGEETCRERFHLCLAKEFENPGTYGAVHHLTVISYKLQHNEYSRRGWLEVRQTLSQFVEQGLTPSEARRCNHQRLDSGQRTWRVTEGEKMPGVEQSGWTRTIADVPLDEPDDYCAAVTQWASSVVANTKQLTSSLGSGAATSGEREL